MKAIIVSIITLIMFSIYGFSQNTAWFTKSSDAKTYAIEKQVPILLIFAGSDWCKPCIMLKTEILHSDEFQQYLPSHFALLYLDFPMHAKNKLPVDLKKQNELLAEKYNKSGLFPNLVMIDTQGKILGNLSFKHQTPTVFINECNTLLSSVNK